MRLFLSIDFSDEIKNILTDAIRQLKRQSSSANFTREENLHLTLAFIGETENYDAAVRAMETIKMQPFDITVSGFGNFGELWWIGIDEKQIGKDDRKKDSKRFIENNAEQIEKTGRKAAADKNRNQRAENEADKTSSGTSLYLLAGRIKKALRSEGFEIDRKKFKPHITIARRVKTDIPPEEIRLDVPRASMTVSGFSLMKSERINGRLTYTELYWKSLR